MDLRFYKIETHFDTSTLTLSHLPPTFSLLINVASTLGIGSELHNKKLGSAMIKKKQAVRHSTKIQIIKSREPEYKNENKFLVTKNMRT